MTKNPDNGINSFYATDFCACAGGNRLKCNGVCRELHTDKATGTVDCREKYRVQRTKAVRKTRKRDGDTNLDVERDQFKQKRKEKFVRYKTDQS